MRYILIEESDIKEILDKLDNLTCLVQNSQGHEMKSLLEAKEAAEYLHMGVNTLYAMTREGKIPHLRVGKKYLFDVKELTDWAKQTEGYRSNE